MKYTSKILDMSAFGYYTFTRGILSVDASDGIKYSVSFDGGKSFQRISPYEEFVPRSGSKIIFEIRFPDNANKASDIYPLNIAGVFPLDVGTTVYFTDGSSTTSVVLGYDGKYNVSLKPGLYTVYYMKSGSKIIIAENYDPRQYVFSLTTDLDKENKIEGFLSRIDWAEITVYDTFVDSSKMQSFSTAKIDFSNNLVDDIGNYVRYWALALL